MNQYIITVKGDANQEVWKDTKLHEEEQIEDIKKVDGLECDTDFVEYITEPLKNKMIDGYCKFVVEEGVLMIITTYTAKERLTDDELSDLMDYTQGQWSDGIGEGFEQNVHSGCYVSMWHPKQKITVEQKSLTTK